VNTARDRRAAALRYADWMTAAPDARLWDEDSRQQIYLSDKAFVVRMQALASRRSASDPNIPKVQRRRSVTTMADWMKDAGRVGEALYRGHREGGLTLIQMAAKLGRTVSRASKAVARFERDRAAA
jgi:hypothetical protein